MSSNAPPITYYIVIGKQPPDVGGSIRPISRLLQEDEETVRAKLLTPTFVVLRRFAKKANADGLQGQLRALGVESFLVSDREIKGHLFLFAATASKGAGGMALRDFADKPLFCPWDDIAGIVLLEIHTEDGGRASLIDLQRTSTNLTPRLDAALFDFAQMLGKEGAGIEEFLRMLEEHAKITVDRRYNKYRADLQGMTRDFGSLPGMFEPPPAMLVSTYAKDEIRAANMFSLLVQREMAARAEA